MDNNIIGQGVKYTCTNYNEGTFEAETLEFCQHHNNYQSMRGTKPKVKSHIPSSNPRAVTVFKAFLESSSRVRTHERSEFFQHFSRAHLAQKRK